MEWGMFSVDVLYTFVLKCTEREKPCVRESPSSVLITNKQFVSNSNWVTHLRLWSTDAEVELNSHPLASPFPSRLRHLSWPHSLLSTTISLNFTPSSSLWTLAPQQASGRGRGGSWNQGWKTSSEKRDVAKLPLLVNHGVVSAHLLPENPC